MQIHGMKGRTEGLGESRSHVLQLMTREQLFTSHFKTVYSNISEDDSKALLYNMAWAEGTTPILAERTFL
jgi:hypothetical protein